MFTDGIYCILAVKDDRFKRIYVCHKRGMLLWCCCILFSLILSHTFWLYY